MTDDEPQVFEDDDQGYLAWCRDHAAGYVLKALRGSLTDPTLHRAECRTLQVQVGENPGWTTYHIKVCADDPGDLTMWSYEHGAAPRDCTRCDPRGGRARRTPRKARATVMSATPAAIDAWRSRLAANEPAEEIAGRRLIEWAGVQDLVLAFTRGAGTAEPESLVLSLALPRGDVGILSTGVTNRSTILDGDELQRTMPFTTRVGYADLLARLQEIPGMRATMKGRHPNIATRDLSGAAWASFEEVFDWLFSEIRRSNSASVAAERP